jgi:fatty acid desaturase
MTLDASLLHAQYPPIVPANNRMIPYVYERRCLKTDAVRTEWVTVGLIAGATGLWLCAGLMWHTVFWPVGLIALPVLAAFHTSLQHETIHGHPTRWPLLNEFIVSLPLAGVFPYRRYRDLHLQHHRDEHLTDPFEDPESYFWCESDVREMNDAQRLIFALNNTFAGRLAIGPILTIIGFARTELRRLRGNEAGVRLAWALHLIAMGVLIAIISRVFAMPLWVYFICVIYPALSLTAMRGYAEHQAAENVGARSAVVETNPALALLFLNNNLHIVHHASPTTPWYDIPALYRERRQQYLTANENTLFLGYWDIARRFAFQVKQPVAHPHLQRATALRQPEVVD